LEKIVTGYYYSFDVIGIKDEEILIKIYNSYYNIFKAIKRDIVYQNLYNPVIFYLTILGILFAVSSILQTIITLIQFAKS
jgi:hypothetical protein